MPRPSRIEKTGNRPGQPHIGVITSGKSIGITLHVDQYFTGRVVIYISNGQMTGERQLSDDEHIARLDAFMDIAKAAGLHVTTEKGLRNA